VRAIKLSIDKYVDFVPMLVSEIRMNPELKVLSSGLGVSCELPTKGSKDADEEG
jgi:hypothetical protein